MNDASTLSLINSPARQSLWIALLLGIVGERLAFDSGLTGPMLTIWLGLLVASASWLARKSSWWRQLSLWGAVAVVAAAMRTLWAFTEVDLAMFLVIITAAAQILLRTASISFTQNDIYQQLLAYVRVPLQTLFGGFSVLTRLGFKPGPANPLAMGAVRGVLFATPFLIVFSLLFAAADVTFENYVGQLPGLFSLTTLQHMLLTLLLGWVALGLLAAAWQPRVAHASPTLAIKLGNVETLIMMGLLALLFVAFAALQMSHLLRDGAGIAQTTGLTIAEYARHGFFQLVFIAALALAMLHLFASCCSNQRLFAGFASLLLVCVLIVLASAVQRMMFYIDSFGLSIDRVEASAVMLWLCGCMALFALTVLRNRPAGFVSSVMTLGIAVCFGLAILNTAALVTRVNLERSLKQQQPPDKTYLYGLGADAVPIMLEYFPRLPSTLQCELGIFLINDWLVADNSNAPHFQDWRRWNYATYQARALVQEHRDQLMAAASRSGDAYYNSPENFSTKAPEHVVCP